jgi:membrane protein DedA with SNARE-associated domain
METLSTIYLFLQAPQNSVRLIDESYIHKGIGVTTMKKKKMNGWLVIGICIAAMWAAVGVLYLIGTIG